MSKADLEKAIETLKRRIEINREIVSEEDYADFVLEEIYAFQVAIMGLERWIKEAEEVRE